MQFEVGGYDLHAAVRVPKGDRKRLEHLARYLLRPAISTERLQLLPDGNYLYELRRPWSDGTTGFLFSPTELLEKLVALIPLPGKNLVRYHGVLAPAAAWRASVVPHKALGEPAGNGNRVRSPAPGRVPWADLLKRVFMVDLLKCTHCGGRRWVLGAVTDPQAAARILEHLGLDSVAPDRLRARGPPDYDAQAS